jgi:hypothetical protein
LANVHVVPDSRAVAHRRAGLNDRSLVYQHARTVATPSEIP